jgi:hypothetical protein
MATLPNNSIPNTGLAKFNGENFFEWFKAMRAVLLAMELWEVVVDRESERPSAAAEVTAWNRKKSRALGLLQLSLTPEVLALVEQCTTPNAVMAELKRQFAKPTWSRRLLFRQRFHSLAMEEGTSVRDYIAKAKAYANDLSAIGDQVGEDLIVIQLLNGLPPSYNQLLVALENVQIPTTGLSATATQGAPSTPYVVPSRRTNSTPGTPRGNAAAAAEAAERVESEDLDAILAPQPFPLTLGYVTAALLQEEERRAKVASNDILLQVRTPGGKAPGPTSKPTGPFHKKGSGKAKVKGSCHYCGVPGHWERDCNKKKADEAAGRLNPKGNRTPRGGDTIFMVHHKVSKRALQSEWIIDTGATVHVTCNLDWFSTYTPMTARSVELPDFGLREAVGVGSIHMEVFQGNAWVPFTLTEVLHIPTLGYNFFSPRKVTRKGFEVRFGERAATIEKDGEVYLKAYVKGKLWRFQARRADLPLVKEAVFHVDRSVTLERWHKRLGHLSPKAIQNMDMKNMVKGLEGIAALDLPDQPCVSCVEANMVQGRFHSRPWDERAKRRLELVHTDLCTVKPTAYGGYNYFVSFTDDFSRMSWVIPLKSKDETFGAFLKWVKEVENFTGERLKRLRCDGGGEYISNQFKAWLGSRGIQQEVTPKKTPEQNGVAERLNRTLCEKMRAMLLDSGLSPKFWAEAAQTACFLRNLSPTRILGILVPSKLRSNKLPNVAYLRVWGCKAFVKVKDYRKKLEPKAKECIFTGYEQEGRVYRFLDINTRKLVRAAAQDVRFMEDFPGLTPKPFDRESIVFPFHPTVSSTDTTTEPSVGAGAGDSEEEINSEPTNAAGSKSEHRGRKRVSFETDNGELESEAEGAALELLESEAGETHTGVEESPSEPRRSARQAAKRQASGAFRWTPKGRVPVDDTLFALIAEEPESFASAMDCADAEKWKEAAQQEYDAIMNNEVWELVDPPPGAPIVRCKWVFRVKQRSDGSVERYKARLVAKGFDQREGINYDKTFANVAKLTSVRVLFALATVENWEVFQIDITCAFLHGDLKETVYMEQPEGFRVKGQERKVCLLRKSLYGLKQAPREWYQKLDSFLLSLGFQRCYSDHSLYILRADRSILIVAVYVDDMLLITNDVPRVDQLKRDLAQTFAMKDLGPVEYYLGIKVERDREKRLTWLSQGTFVDKVAERFHLQDAKPVSTPMELGTKLSLDMAPKSKVEKDYMLRVPYASAVGSLMYAAMGTRPELAYTVGQVSRFSSNPGKQHWEATKRAIRYLKGTNGSKLTFSGSMGTQIVPYSDADFSSCPDTSKSTTGSVITLAGGAVSWKSKKQSIIAQSTTESEYVAVAEATKEVQWICGLLAELGFPQGVPTLKVDNQSAIALANDPVLHERTKHIKRRYHFIREAVNNGDLKLEHCPTEEMLADVLTKPLGRDRHAKLAQALGVLA